MVLFRTTLYTPPGGRCVEVYGLQLPVSTVVKHHSLATAHHPAQVAQGRALHNRKVGLDRVDREHVINEHRGKAAFNSVT